MVGRGVSILVFMWRDACAEMECTKGKLTDITRNMLESVLVASVLAMMEAREGHDGFG